MIRKYLVILAAAAVMALVAALAGVALSALLTESRAAKAAREEPWSLGPVAVRGEEQYRRAADGFRDRYRWLVPEEPAPADKEEPAETAAGNAPPPLPAWRFVGVVIEESEASQLALIAEAGRVNRYKAGDEFVDGTRLVAVAEQSVTVSQGGVERNVHLYRRN